MVIRWVTGKRIPDEVEAALLKIREFEKRRLSALHLHGEYSYSSSTGIYIKYLDPAIHDDGEYNRSWEFFKEDLEALRNGGVSVDYDSNEPPEKDDYGYKIFIREDA